MVFDKKEYMKEYMKQYQKEYKKEYHKTPQYKKTYTLSHWKRSGLIGDYEAIYQRYLNTNNCDLCNILLCEGRGGNRKCMDHCHNTGQFRNIVCNTCNSIKSDNKIRTDNTTGYKNVYYCNTRKRWVYQKKFKGKLITIRRKNKIDILCIKFAGIILYKY